MNVWRVTYRTVFSSSVGMQPYKRRYRHTNKIVITETFCSSIDSLVAAILETLDEQTTFGGLMSVEWLGLSVNEPRKSPA